MNTKFERNGVQRQYEAISEQQAAYSFQISCKICDSKCITDKYGNMLTCDKCAINEAHGITMKVFEIIKKA